MNATSFSVKRSNSRCPLKSCQTRSAPISACTARTLGVTAISRNLYDMAALLRATPARADDSERLQPALASGGASGANDRKIDISLRDHVEQVGEDVLGGNSEDLHD